MATGYCSGQEVGDKMGNLFTLILFTSVFSMSYTKECEMRSYYDRIQEGCVPCGEYPDGCNALDNVTQTNCLTNCKIQDDRQIHHDNDTNHNESYYKVRYKQSRTTGNKSSCRNNLQRRTEICDNIAISDRRIIEGKDALSKMSSCGPGSFPSTINGPCNACPNESDGCNTFKPLYMETFNACMKYCGFLNPTISSSTTAWSTKEILELVIPTVAGVCIIMFIAVKVALRVKSWLKQRESRRDNGYSGNSNYNDVSENAPDEGAGSLTDNTPAGRSAEENEDEHAIAECTPHAVDKIISDDDLEDVNEM